MKKDIKKSLTNSSPRICLVGPGVVGKATGLGFLAKGIHVTFVGVTPSKVEKLREEKLDAYTVEEMREREFDYDISLLTVPTPTVDGKPDLSYIKDAAAELGKRLKKTDRYHVIVVKSTVVPGTTRNIVLPIVEKFSGKKAGKDFGVAMNPEYLREKTAVDDAIEPWFVVIGEYDKKSGDVLAQIYKDFDCPVKRVTLEQAETQKYMHNLFNAVKITFFNEMRELAKATGVEPEEIIPYVVASCEGIWNGSYGTKDYGPYDGACLPKDTKAYLHFAKTRGLSAPLLAATIQVNEALMKKKKAQELEESEQSSMSQKPLVLEKPYGNN